MEEKNTREVIMQEALEQAASVEEEAFVQAGICYVTGYLQNLQIAVFRILKERNELIEADEEELAAEYQSAILLAYFTGDLIQFEKQLRCFYHRTIKNGI